jgi:hypothetical protein
VRAEGRVFWGLGIFFTIVALVYGFVSQEPVGTAGIALSAGLGYLIGFYMEVTGRRVGIRPEDNSLAEVSEGAGDVGFFSPYSWWPLALGSCVAIVFLGVVFAWWLVALGVAALVFSLFGFLFEYYRGEHAH